MSKKSSFLKKIYLQIIKLCYNYCVCSCGEIGRRDRLKIYYPKDVSVRVRPRAPKW